MSQPPSPLGSPYAPPHTSQVTPGQADGPQPIDAILPTNPLAAAACWCGILSVVVCGIGGILGPPAIIMGVMSLKRGAMANQSSFGKTTSTIRSWIGIVAGGVGTAVGLALVGSMLFRG